MAQLLVQPKPISKNKECVRKGQVCANSLSFQCILIPPTFLPDYKIMRDVATATIFASVARRRKGALHDLAGMANGHPGTSASIHKIFLRLQEVSWLNFATQAAADSRNSFYSRRASEHNSTRASSKTSRGCAAPVPCAAPQHSTPDIQARREAASAV